MRPSTELSIQRRPREGVAMSQPQRPKAFDRLRAVAVAGAALAAATVMPSAAGAATPRAIAANAPSAPHASPHGLPAPR